MTKLEYVKEGRRLIKVEDWECLILPKQKQIPEYVAFDAIYRDCQGQEREFYLTAGGQDTGVLMEKDGGKTPIVILKRIYLALQIFKKIEELEDL